MKFSKSTRAETDFEWLYTDWQGKAMIRLGSDKKNNDKDKSSQCNLKWQRVKDAWSLMRCVPCMLYNLLVSLWSPQNSRGDFPLLWLPRSLSLISLESEWQRCSARDSRVHRGPVPPLPLVSTTAVLIRAQAGQHLHARCILQKLRSSILKQVFSILGVGF